MSVATQPLTYAELCRKREEDGVRYELIEGELVVVAAPSPRHQLLSRRLVVRFDAVMEQTGLGEVFDSPLDVRFADGSVVQPDVIVVLADRAHIIQEKLIEGAPNLLVEISSPSSRATDRTRKARLYARQGVSEYWWVDPEARSIWVHAAPDERSYRTIREETVVAQSATIPGLAVTLADLFAPARVGPRAPDQ
jgi:Uma2 family endonuclease